MADHDLCLFSCRVWQQWTSQTTLAWLQEASQTLQCGCGASRQRSCARSSPRQVQCVTVIADECLTTSLDVFLTLFNMTQVFSSLPRLESDWQRVRRCAGEDHGWEDGQWVKDPLRTQWPSVRHQLQSRQVQIVSLVTFMAYFIKTSWGLISTFNPEDTVTDFIVTMITLNTLYSLISQSWHWCFGQIFIWTYPI